MQRRQQWKEKLVAEIKGQAVYIKGFRVFPGERRFKQTTASSVSFLILHLCTASCRDLETLWPNGDSFLGLRISICFYTGNYRAKRFDTLAF